MGLRQLHVVAAALVTSLLVTGCRLDVDTAVSFSADETAQVTVSAGFDAPLLQQLDRLGLDPLAALMPAQELSWRVSRSVDANGLLRVGLTKDAPDFAQVADVLDSLSVGLSDTDVGLRFDMTVTTSGDVTVMSGTALFTPPSTQGVWLDNTPLGLTADQLALKAAEAADVWFTITTQGTVLDHNADEADANRVRWRMPVNEPVNVMFVFEPADTRLGMLPVALIVMTLLAGAGWLVWRKRRARGMSADEAPSDEPENDGA